MSKPKQNINQLLAAIQRKAPAAPAHSAPAPNSKRAEAASSRSRAGKPVQFWLHEEDRQLVRELAAWLAGQGIRVTDSMVIRTVLRTARTGNELLDAYRQASLLDGRIKPPAVHI